MSRACLVDTTRCIGCRACQVACKQWNDLPAEATHCGGTGDGYENPPALSDKTYTRITFHEILDHSGRLQRCVFVKRQCMHCRRPSCVSACPVAALEKVKDEYGNPTGPVVYHGSKCMGCRYCMMACPFDVPTLQWDRPVAYVRKCTFCADRQAQTAPGDVAVDGQRLQKGSLERFGHGWRTPACAMACPTGAIQFGDRQDLLSEARRRIAAQNAAANTRKYNTWKYQQSIYGEKEVGGTAWLYISNVPFDELGFRTDLGQRAYPDYTRLALDSVPAAVLGVGAVMGGVYWLTTMPKTLRRNRLK